MSMVLFIFVLFSQMGLHFQKKRAIILINSLMTKLMKRRVQNNECERKENLWKSNQFMTKHLQSMDVY